MDGLSKEACAVIAVVEEVARLKRQFGGLEAAIRDTRDWNQADYLESQMRDTDGQIRHLLAEMQASGVTLEYAGNTTTVLKEGHPWLVFGWHDCAAVEQLRGQLEAVTTAARGYLVNSTPVNAGKLSEALESAKGEQG